MYSRTSILENFGAGASFLGGHPGSIPVRLVKYILIFPNQAPANNKQN